MRAIPPNSSPVRARDGRRRGRVRARPWAPLALALWTTLAGVAAAQEAGPAPGMPGPGGPEAAIPGGPPGGADLAGLPPPVEAPTDAAAVEEADGLYLEGNLPGAIAAYKQMLAAFPDSSYQARVLYRLGDALAREGRQEEARIYWERLLASGPEAPFAQAVEDALLPIYRREGELERALDILLNRLGRAPAERKADLLVEVAELRLGLGDPERAIRDLLRRQRYLPPEERGRGSAYVKEVIDTRLSLGQLTDLVDRFPEAVPGAWILERLVRLHDAAGDAYLTQKWGERYVSAYPDRPFADTAGDLIREQKRRLRAYRHRVGVLLHLSGDMAAYGERVLNGIQVAYRTALKGLPTGEVALWVRDLDADQPLFSTPASALFREADPEVVIGPMLSSEVRDVARVASRARVPLIAPLVPRPAGVGPIVLGLGITPEMEGTAAARLGVGDELLRFVTVAPEGPYGMRVAAAFRAELERLGGEVQATVFYGAGEQDIRKRIRRLVADDVKAGGVPAVTAEDMEALPEAERDLAGIAPEEGQEPIQIGTEPLPPLQGPPVGPHGYFPTFDAVFLPGPWERVVVAAPHLPFQDIDVPIIGTSGWNDPRLIRTGGTAVTGARFVSPLDRDGPAAREFVRAYREAYGEMPDLFAALGFDAMRLALRAFAEGAADPWARLAGPLDGATGPLVVAPDGGVVRTLPVLKVGRTRFARAGEVPLSDPWPPPAPVEVAPAEVAPVARAGGR